MRRIEAFQLRARAHNFSFDFKTLQCIDTGDCLRSPAPFVLSAATPHYSGRASSRARLLTQKDQNRRSAFDNTLETKPRAQWNAAGINPRDAAEIKDHDTPSAAV
jgi:hypothetical protein